MRAAGLEGVPKLRVEGLGFRFLGFRVQRFLGENRK